ncbi:TPA: hypothetical protein ACPZPV_002278 [Yersinia enterocolitica]|uniref:hypothetical protein n=1 Tax=Yersinia enterocolitica TaxID=630 RepID=UPI0028B29465|nr:hypothetical protein [Yersinia enterocolitica]EKN5995657.1 hypothetical protein [Yersinia enterocolitica]ELI8371652.1 hypothetical protein [Yersinia enterocolitica]HDM9019710.1 hypothetical protein [Yersinia enterocolitica]HEI6738482.1 hypothetical protein [Yersinia enterocolitica]
MTDTKIMPISMCSPLKFYFDPSTGGLVLECVHSQGGLIGELKMQISLDAEGTQQLLSSLPTLQKEFGELVSLRANKGFLQ